MSMDEPFRCNLCDGLEFGSREELDKHTREKHSTVVYKTTYITYFQATSNYYGLFLCLIILYYSVSSLYDDDNIWKQ